MRHRRFLPTTQHRYLLLAALLALLARTVEAHDTITLTAQGLQGVSQAARGDFVQIYTAQLRDNVVNALTDNIGLPGTNLGIQITLSDLSTPTGIQASDLGNLTLYRSLDAIVDAGDVTINIQPAVIGGVIEFDATGAAPADRLIPSGGAIYFIIAATISPTATLGTAFRLGAAAGHIGIDESGIPGPIDGTTGPLIAASDANHVAIGDVATSHGVPVSIPFGGETVIVLLLVGTGIYALRRAA